MERIGKTFLCMSNRQIVVFLFEIHIVQERNSEGKEKGKERKGKGKGKERHVHVHLSILVTNNRTDAATFM